MWLMKSCPSCRLQSPKFFICWFRSHSSWSSSVTLNSRGLSVAKIWINFSTFIIFLFYSLSYYLSFLLYRFDSLVEKCYEQANQFNSVGIAYKKSGSTLLPLWFSKQNNGRINFANYTIAIFCKCVLRSHLMFPTRIVLKVDINILQFIDHHTHRDAIELSNCNYNFIADALGYKFFCCAMRNIAVQMYVTKANILRIPGLWFKKRKFSDQIFRFAA